jgi:hypothetical protein
MMNEEGRRSPSKLLDFIIRNSAFDIRYSVFSDWFVEIWLRPRECVVAEGPLGLGHKVTKKGLAVEDSGCEAASRAAKA